MKKSIFVAFLSAIILFGCQQQMKTGIAGNDNDNNRVVVADNSNITINDKPKTITESQIVPEDTLKKIYPGVSVNFATELLGEAKINYLGKIGSIVTQSLRSANFYTWHFDNVFIQITSEDNQSISTITLMKRAMERATRYIYDLSFYKV